MKWGEKIKANLSDFYTMSKTAFGISLATIGNGGMNTANDWLGYAGYGEGTFGASQIGMLGYRQSLSINSRIGTFGSFSSTYKYFGYGRKGLGLISTYVGTPLNTFPWVVSSRHNIEPRRVRIIRALKIK